MSKQRLCARRGWSRPLFLLVGCMLLGGPLFFAAAAESNRQLTAEQLVQEALHREIYGMQADRGRLLDAALAKDPDYEPARWQRGFVRTGGQWIKVDDIPRQQNELWRQYEALRSQAPQTVAGQMQLAQWCQQQGLPEQRRAHLMRVLDLDPENDSAKLQLGFELVNGEWITAEQKEQQQQRQEAAREAFVKWRRPMIAIRAGLHRHNRPRRMAMEQLAQIVDPAAIDVMERVLSVDSERLALLVVDKLAAMPSPIASRSLARHAVYSPWKKVREEAAERLQERRVDSFVPHMLSAMHQPITSRTFVQRTRGGGWTYRHSLMRESQDERRQIVVDSAAPTQRTQLAIHRDNLRTQLLNQRIAKALNVATDQDLPTSPQAWWQWWNQRNEIYVEGPKPLRTTSRNIQLARIERVRDLEQAERNRQAAQRARQAQLIRMQSMASPQRRSDCLAAGTIVWTMRGPRAVESLQVGDMLLGQHLATGELAYKPVLRTTIRPATVLVKIDLGGETIQASGGHPFWVAGEGWIKARNLKAGMVLHGLHGPINIRGIDKGQNQQSYNVIVDDFHNYFVGESRLLSHDNTVRQATDALVPGLLER